MTYEKPELITYEEISAITGLPNNSSAIGT
jgi:hypothetical protein